ncbi:GldG family protein [Shumkonia mesophila]|uniref:GldG family protein n=1 Tax=Shumkonia mesophila TaxID=2838854 RepID=UPI002934727A|nr:Gldg family protein [Shumkonia mesophila]
MERIKALGQSKIAVIAGVMAVILFVCVNVLSETTLRSARLDLTENKLFTLSQGTREVLAAIDEPITLRLYASRSLAEGAPAYGDFIGRVRELLQQYADLSRGMIRLQIYNPEPYSVQEDEAVAYGLQGVQLDQGGETVYFGLAATNSTDDQEVVPFFDTQRERYLEYDLTRMLFNLAHPKKKVVGLMAFLPIDSDPLKEYKPWAVVEQLEQFVTVRAIGRSVKHIPDDIDLLMIVHPVGVEDATLYAIDQYVLRGGRAVVFVDPHSEAEAEMSAAMRRPPADTGSDLGKLFAAWGIDYSPTTFIGDREAATRVQVPGAGGRPAVTDYVSWLGLTQQNFNANDVTTSEIARVFMAAAGALSKKDGTDIEFTPLIQTSERAMRIEASKVRMQPDPARLLKNFKSEAHPFTLAARIQGRLKTAFPDGAPKEAAGEAKEGGEAAPDTAPKAEHLTQSVGQANLIVVADTDMLADRSWLQFQNFFGRQVAVPTANNAAFVINAVDNLLGSNALINLRSRGLSVRPFHRIEALKRDAEQRYSKTEQELLEKLKVTNEQMGKLNTKDGSGEAILSDSQRETMAKFRADLIDIRQQLREVQHNLRKDIEALDTGLKIINIWAVPAIICLIAVAMAWAKRRRHRLRSIDG